MKVTKSYSKLYWDKITVIDDCMGSGKTSWAIQYMNEAPEDKKFIFITPFLDEVERVVKSVKNRTFEMPKPKNTKLQDIKLKLEMGCNIVTTHALFKNFDEDVLSLLRMHNYVLVMDEVVEMIEHVKITKNDIDMLVMTNKISVDKNKSVKWIEEDYEGRFSYIKHMCETEKLFLHNGTAMLWTFPIEVLEQFRDIFVLTYMFDCQVQRYYFDLHEITYEKKSISQVISNDGENSYSLTNFINRSANQYNQLITIYDGKMNNIGIPSRSNYKQGYDDLTFTKLTNMQKQSKIAKTLKRNLESFFTTYGTKAEFNMWTCPEETKSKLKGKKYTGSKKNICHVPHNKRATNEFGHKSTLAYVLNKFMNPNIVGFFKDNGIVIDQDAYALSELLQWIFRSRIRNGEPITLFIPSLRMRALLEQWLNDEPIQWG